MLPFRPRDDELIFLEDNNISWSELGHWAISKKKDEIEGVKKMNKNNHLRAASIDLMLFFFGVICFAISYVVTNMIVFIILNVAALFSMCAGAFLLIKEFRLAKQEEDE